MNQHGRLVHAGEVHPVQPSSPRLRGRGRGDPLSHITGTAELRTSLQFVAAVARDLDVRVQVLTTKGEGPNVVHVHPAGGKLAQAPVAPGRAPPPANGEGGSARTYVSAGPCCGIVGGLSEFHPDGGA